MVLIFQTIIGRGDEGYEEVSVESLSQKEPSYLTGTLVPGSKEKTGYVDNAQTKFGI